MITPSGIYTFRDQKKPIPPHYYCVFVRGIIIKAPLTGRKKEKCTDHSLKSMVNRERNPPKGRDVRKKGQRCTVRRTKWQEKKKREYKNERFSDLNAHVQGL